MELINRFGAVPWVNTALNENSPEAYGPRVDREIVADSVLNRLKWAEANIGDFEKQDGANTINRDCIRAAISRFALREATWRKYHGIDGAQKFFDECIRVSRLLMNDYPTLYYGTDGQPAAGYGEMWTTEDLGKVPGVILYMEFVQDIKMANFSALEHMDSHNVEMNQHTVDLYLCKDGKPIATSANYHGDKTPYATFRDRDPRLYHVVMPPYKVKAKVKTKEDPRTGFVRSRSGYYFWKNWSNWETNRNGGVTLNTSDKPIFKIEEVLLNYAEAMCETGQFTQAVADESINKLRRRAGVADMKVADIDDSFDPNRGRYYPKGNEQGLVDPVLWEVRRERIVELMGEGFGFYDIRRWRMAPWFLNRQFKGMWMTKDKFRHGAQFLLNETTGGPDPADGAMTEGYIYLQPDPIKAGEGWQERYYLYEVPTQEIILNPALAPNNPGWE